MAWMNITALSYNTLSAFGDPARTDKALRFVADLKPDIAFLADAYHANDDTIIVNEAVLALQALGYQVTRSDNNDKNDRTDRSGFFGLVRTEIGAGTVLYNATARDAYVGEIHQSNASPVTFGGIHLDDRNEHERLLQASLTPDVDILMGDFNALHANTPIARVLRPLSLVTERLPEFNPDTATTKNKLAMIGSLAQRLVRMADGSTLKHLEARGYHDIDHLRRPTMRGLVQLDHIMVSDRLSADNFQVHNDVHLSDHKPISARLTIDR